MELTSQYKDFKTKVESQRELIREQQEILNTLLEGCPHEEVETKSSYFSGSYYDLAYTDYWNECLLCGARSERTTREHNHYG